MSNKNENEFNSYKYDSKPAMAGKGRKMEEAPVKRSAPEDAPKRRYEPERETPRREAPGRETQRSEAQGREARRRTAAAAPKRRKKRKFPVVLIILLALIAAGGIFVFAQLGRIDRTRLKNIITNAGVGASGYRNIVLYGVDSRTGDMTKDTHSDTIMICSINNKTGEIKLASVYRDTYLDNTNGEFRKATECYFFGGPERSINMLNKNLDLDITDFVTVDFSCVIKIVDALGGIDLDITEEEMGYINGYCVENKQVTGVDYTPLTTSGYVHLEGIQALAYCRIRYTEGWDYKRTERQRTVMNLCFAKAKEQGVTSMLAVANSLLGNIATSMSNTEILGLVGNLGKYTLGEQTGFPFDKMPANLPDGGDCVVPVNLASNVSQLHSFLFGEDGYTVSSTVSEISNTIINNTGIQ